MGVCAACPCGDVARPSMPHSSLVWIGTGGPRVLDIVVSDGVAGRAGTCNKIRFYRKVGCKFRFCFERRWVGGSSNLGDGPVPVPHDAPSIGWGCER